MWQSPARKVKSHKDFRSNSLSSRSWASSPKTVLHPHRCLTAPAHAPSDPSPPPEIQPPFSPFSGGDLPIFPRSALLSYAKDSGQAPSWSVCVPICVCLPWGSESEGRDRPAVRQKEEIPLPGVRAHFPAIKAGWKKSTTNGNAHPTPLQPPIGNYPGAVAWENKSHQQGLVLSSTAVD